MIIERATLSDADEILALQKYAYQSEAAIYQDYTIQPLTQTLDSIQAEFANYIVLKVVLDAQIVGSVRAILQQNTCLIEKLMVHPHYQNCGIGSRLMIEIEKLFSNATRFELFTGYRSERNIHLYHKLGYKEYQRKQVNPDLTLVFMEKYISR